MSQPETTVLPPEPGNTVPPSRNPDSGRATVLIMYALYFAFFITGITFFAAVVLAYVQRDDLRGTVYESHITNGIEVFWASLIAGIVGFATMIFGVGFLILFGLVLWYFYRTIKGFLRALDARPFR